MARVMPVPARRTALRPVLLQALGGLALASTAAVVGFAASLLRRRPPTTYATSLRQPVPQPDSEQGS
jgi:hypothetical protein